MWSSWNQALHARCLVSASATALITMSLKETLTSRAVRDSAARSMSTSVVRKKWGMGPREVASRLAIVLRIWVRGTSSKGVRGAQGSRVVKVPFHHAAPRPRSLHELQVHARVLGDPLGQGGRFHARVIGGFRGTAHG